MSEYTLALAPPDVITAATRWNGNGQGDLMRELEKHPLAQAERGEPRHMDSVYLSRFVGTDYVRWYGRCSDGRFYPIGRIMEIVPVDARAEIRREVRTTILPALIDVITDPDFAAALEASGELDACESGTESRSAGSIQTVSVEDVKE